MVQAGLLPDGRRLHLNHGPIDLLIEAWGEPSEIAAACAQAARRFPDILPGLVGELPLLRRAYDAAHPGAEGPVARRMVAACRPYPGVFLTPMIAVAGAVADEMLSALLAGRRLARAYVNDGGDIALHLAEGEHLTLGLVSDIEHPGIDGSTRIAASSPVRGVATSGRGGRSFSLGIADAVTVLARNAAAADTAATLIANAVDIDHPAVERRPARDLDPDSDLGDRLVTIGLGYLPPARIAEALDRGAACADRLGRAGLIDGAVLSLRGAFRISGPVAPALASAA
jgi:ApbE superfamily uncharacterized protein (UPF0280 family)